MLRSMRRRSYLKPYGPVSSGQRPNKFLIPSQSALSTPPHLHSGGSHEYFTQDAWAYLMFIRHRQTRPLPIEGKRARTFGFTQGQAFQSCRSSLKECHPEQRRSFARRMIVTAEGSAVERQGLLRLHHGQQVTEPLHGNYEQYLSPCARA